MILGGSRVINEANRKENDTMMTAEEISERIQGALPGAEVDVIDTMGDAQHWKVLVTSERFRDLSLIEQHKLVMSSLQDEIGKRMHAVEIKTMLPEEGR